MSRDTAAVILVGSAARDYKPSPVARPNPWPLISQSGNGRQAVELLCVDLTSTGSATADRTPVSGGRRGPGHRRARQCGRQLGVVLPVVELLDVGHRSEVLPVVVGSLAARGVGLPPDRGGLALVVVVFDVELLYAALTSTGSEATP